MRGRALKIVHKTIPAGTEERNILLSRKNLEQTCEWRPRLWAPVIGSAIERFGPDRIAGKSILEIGFGTGRYAVLWAQLGANVTGIEHKNPENCVRASALAERLGVADRCRFIVGDFFQIEEQFDVVITKSVLFSIPTLALYERWISKFASLLKSDGEALVVENGSGTRFVHFYRKYLHRWRSYADHVLSNPAVVDLFRRYFSDIEVQTFYTAAQLTPLKAVIDYELQKPPRFNDCFIYWLHARRPKIGVRSGK